MAKRPPQSPAASHPKEDSDKEELDEDRYPNMAARRDLDRARHIQAAQEMGATHRQAVRHADDEVGGH